MPDIHLPGYRSGNYFNRCIKCHEEFQGAKGSVYCIAHAAECAFLGFHEMVAKLALATTGLKNAAFELDKANADRAIRNVTQNLSESLGSPFIEFERQLASVAEDGDRSEWLVLQLSQWPVRVDQNKTTNITYLMNEAAAEIARLRAVVATNRPAE